MKPSGWTRRLGLGGVVVALGLLAAACGDPRGATERKGGEIVFSILSAQGQASSGPVWAPLLEDMARATGVAVKPHFASDYSALIADMKRGQVQAAWFSAQPAIEAIDTADAEVIARTVNQDGEDSYHAVLIASRESGLDLKTVLDCGKRLDFGIGDPRSTSGALAPRTFLFGPRRISPETCFRSVRSANHERNAFEVASGVLDVATSNTVTLANLARQNPNIAAEIREIWRSPPIPEGGILVRGDLDPALKEKIRAFFLTYGRGEGVEAERQRKVLAGLNYSRFIAADGDYLDPVREMIADEALVDARAKGDRAAASAAERELVRLRQRREVQP